MFAPAGIVVDQVPTTHLGHARDVVQHMTGDDLYAYAGIIIVSGDGLIAEVYQGLAQRDDADSALQIPLGPLPAGSGNGLCKSIMHAAGLSPEPGPVDHLDAARLICRGASQPLDLAAIELSGASDAVPNPFTSFLSISWALIGDVDISADFLRPYLGAARGRHSYSRRLRYPRLYHGTIEYRPPSVSRDAAPMPPLGTPLDADDGWITLEGPFLNLWACNVPWMTLDSEVAPDADINDGLWQLAVSHGPELASLSPSELQGMVVEVQEAMDAHDETHPHFAVIAASAFRLLPTGRAEGATDETEEEIRAAGAKAMVRAIDVTADEAEAAMVGVRTEVEVDRVIELVATGESKYADEMGFISVDGEWAKYGDVQVDVLPGKGRVFFSHANKL